MKDYIKKLKALSDETRVRILRLLTVFDWLYVCEIVYALDLPFCKISRHLKELENAGILEQERNGRYVKYFFKEKDSDFSRKLIELINSLKDNEFKDDIENARKKIDERKENNCKLGCKK